MLSAGVAASLLPGCTMTPSEKAVAPSGDDAAKTVLDGIGEHLLARAPETATTLGLDTDARRGAAVAARRSQPRRSGRPGSAAPYRPGPGRGHRHARPQGARDPDHRRGREVGVPHRARRLRAPVWRCCRRRVAQHALRGDPERGRLPRRPAVPRCRASGADRAGCRGVPGPPGELRAAARRRAGAAAGGRRARADRPRVPARQGDRADGDQRRRRPQGRRVGGQPGATDQGHPGQLGPPRRDPGARQGGSCAGAPAGRTEGAAHPRDDGRRHVGAAARRRVLPVGPARVDDDADVARRGAPAGRAASQRAAGADGRNPEGPGLHQGHGRRAHDRAGRRQALPVPGQRCRPGPDPGLHPGAADDDPRQAAARRSARLPRATSRSGGCRPRRSRARPAPTAAPGRSTARSPASTGSTWAPRSCTAATACRRSRTTRRSRGTSGRASTPTSCR